MAAQKVNPFYIAANQNINDDDDDDLDRQDDNNVDLDDLLEDGDGVQSSRVPTVFSQPRRRPPSSSSSSSSGCSRSGLAFLIVLVLVIVLTRDWSGGSTANGLLPHNGNKDPKVVVLAERNTGGNWLVEQLGPCFPNLIVTESLQRAGYLFQDLTKYQDKTWVVVVVRDPYEWVLSMRDHPLHAPDHTALSLADFVTKKWTTENIKDEDTQLKGETGQVCQEYFTYQQVVPCVERVNTNENPVYELKRDGSAEPYDSILDLRADKITNFLNEVGPNVENHTLVRYEDLVQGVDGKKGMEQVIWQIEQWTGETASCEAAWLDSDGTDPKTLQKDDYDAVNQHAHWDVETSIGYSQHYLDPVTPVPAAPKKNKGKGKDKDKDKKNAAPKKTVAPKTAAPKKTAAPVTAAPKTATPKKTAAPVTAAPKKTAVPVTAAPKKTEGT